MKRLITIIAVLCAVAVYFWISSSQQGPQSAATPAPVVRVAEVKFHPIVETIEAVGTARAWEAVQITAKSAGKVSAIHFEENTPVKGGDVIVELEAGNERAVLREEEVILAEERRILNHYQTLIKTNAVSKTLLEEQLAKVAASEQRVKAERATLAEFDIAAPFDGYLGVRHVSVGSLVSPGTLITTLDDIDPLRLDFTVPERWIGQIRVGQMVHATSVAYPGEQFEARITSIGTRVDPATRAVTVHASLANGERHLRPGMLLSVRLDSVEREALMITEQALQLEGSNRFVFVVNDDRTVQRVAVQSGTRLRGKVEIVAGISAGDRVVSEGTQKVRQGIQVVIAGEEPAAP